MPKFVVTYWETFTDDYEVEAENENEAYEKVWNDIFEGRRDEPEFFLDSGWHVQKVEEKEDELRADD